jgi:hypothetical protein
MFGHVFVEMRVTSIQARPAVTALLAREIGQQLVDQLVGIARHRFRVQRDRPAKLQQLLQFQPLATTASRRAVSWF